MTLKTQKKSRCQIIQRHGDRTGAMLPLIAVLIAFLFVSAVIAVDLSRIHVVRSELRTATDAAARAGVEVLGRGGSDADAIEAAVNIARLNQVAGQPLELDPSKIILGAAEQNPDGSFSFVDRANFGSDGNAFANSVQVLGERTSTSPSGQVNLIFGGLFGVDKFEPVQSATATRLDRDVALVLDKSGSMRNDNKFAGLLEAVDVFVEELEASSPVENVSLTVYDETPEKLLELTENLQEIQGAISDVDPGGFTGIGEAMLVGLNSLLNDPTRRRLALKSMIVMTDGRQNRGIGPMAAAQQCLENDVVVHTITFGGNADEDLMQQVSDLTGGTHLHAANNRQLIEAFKTIARQLEVILIE